MKDLYNDLGVVNLLSPADVAGVDTASKILDLAGMNGAIIQAYVGPQTGVDADNHLTPVLEESDTTVGTDFTAVAAGDILGGFTKVDSTSEDDVVQVAGYKGAKRYIRVNFNFTGTITVGLVGAVGIVGNATKEPVTAPAAITAS